MWLYARVFVIYCFIILFTFVETVFVFYISDVYLCQKCVT
jgi:hypothetical protein